MTLSDVFDKDGMLKVGAKPVQKKRKVRATKPKKEKDQELTKSIEWVLRKINGEPFVFQSLVVKDPYFIPYVCEQGVTVYVNKEDIKTYKNELFRIKYRTSPMSRQDTVSTLCTKCDSDYCEFKPANIKSFEEVFAEEK